MPGLLTSITDLPMCSLHATHTKVCCPYATGKLAAATLWFAMQGQAQSSIADAATATAKGKAHL